MSRMGLQSQRTADMVSWRGGRLLQLAGGFRSAQGGNHGRGARGAAPLPCPGKATVVGVVSSLWK